MKIAVDAMGGDHAPQYPVAGAVLAVRNLGADVVLVGRESDIVAALPSHRPANSIEIVNAEQVIGMDEAPALGLRRKRHSSLHAAARLLRDGAVQGVVSAGNTGAAMVITKTLVGSLTGVDRPALAIVLPTITGHCVLLDVGANVAPKSRHLVQFAVMGDHFAREILRLESPRIGLLSVGEEAGKGNELIRMAHLVLQETSLNFRGNVEARDIYNGSTDVVVCDGFTGNAVLKACEAAVDTMRHMLREELASSLAGRIGAFLAHSAFKRFRKRVDWAEFGGALLLGVRGLTIICHGRSNPRAIMNGVRVAMEYGRQRVDQRIEEALAALPAGGAEPAAIARSAPAQDR